MAREYIDRVTVTVKGKDLDDLVNEMTEERTRSVKAVNTMNKARRAKGFKRANMAYKLTMKTEQVDDPDLPDWDDLLESGELVKIVKTPRVGRKVTFFDSTVTDVQDSNQDGDSSQTVTLIALRRKKG